MTIRTGQGSVSRRDFMSVSAMLAASAATGFGQSAALTAGQVVDRIKANLGVPWREGPTDSVQPGDATTPVTRIGTTVVSTFDVIKRAAAARKNMVISHQWATSTGYRSERGVDTTAACRKKRQFMRHNNTHCSRM